MNRSTIFAVPFTVPVPIFPFVPFQFPFQFPFHLSQFPFPFTVPFKNLKEKYFLKWDVLFFIYKNIPIIYRRFL